ncbi:MAG: hypothetical protein ACRDGM_07870 [bacterium]
MTADIVVVTAGGTWTYEADFALSRDVIRFTIQDTDGSNPLFTDEEVAYALGAAAGNTSAASVFLVNRLLARYAALSDTEDGELAVKAGQLYDHYKSLLATLTNPFESGASGSVKPYAGGISIADVRTRRADTDRVPSLFDRSFPPLAPSSWRGGWS